MHSPFQLLILPFLILAVHSFAQNDYEKEVREFRQQLIQSALEYEKDPPLSPADTGDLSYFPIDTFWKLKAKFHPLQQDSFIKIPTTAGTEKIFKIIGMAVFKVNSVADSLTVFQPFQNGLQPYLFIPFKDGTSGITSYGGGRYLEPDLSSISEEGNTIILDFNKAYNPWCAYSSGYFCPLPPEENDLRIKITAGEKKFNPYESN